MDHDDELNSLLKSGSDAPQYEPTVNDPWGTAPSAKQTFAEDDEIGSLIEQGFCQWSTSDGRIFCPTSSTTNSLTPGVYEIGMSSKGLFFEKIPVKTEGLLRFPDSTCDVVLSEIQTFWDREDVFKQFELIYKRGILLWGPPGGGKSSLVQLIMQDVIRRNGIAFRFDEPSLFLDGMRAFRKIQPETPAVIIMEDIDSIIRDWSESEVLNILDGVNEVYKMVFLATTNYPGELGARVVNRPSRFDKRFKIEMPNEACRRVYLEYLFQKSDMKIDLGQWVKDTNKFSIAHLKELFIAVIILGDEYKSAIKTLRNMSEEIKDEAEHDKMMGFLSESN